MPDDLRDRIRRGDLAALSDPALPLHLLADGPTAEWWVSAQWKLAAKIIIRLTPYSEPGDYDRAKDVDMLRTARRLRALLASAPAEVDRALEVLERYAG